MNRFRCPSLPISGRFVKGLAEPSVFNWQDWQDFGFASRGLMYQPSDCSSQFVVR